jgi:hypothetical protein
MDDPVYKKPLRGSTPNPNADSLNPTVLEVIVNPNMPTFVQLQEKQRSELLEMAKVRYGLKGPKVSIQMASLDLNTAMTEAQVFKALLLAPDAERPDQVLYALAKGDIDADMANRVLVSLELLSKMKSIRVI